MAALPFLLGEARVAEQYRTGLLLGRLDAAAVEAGFSRPETFRVAVLAWCEASEEKARLRRRR